MENEKKELLKLLDFYIKQGIFELVEETQQFKFTEKGAELYEEYLTSLTDAIIDLAYEKGYSDLNEKEFGSLVKKGLLETYQNNEPSIFIHVLHKAKEMGFDNYAKFELSDPTEETTFH